MPGHEINVRFDGGRGSFVLKQHIRRAIRTALALEDVETPCRVDVRVTDDEGIRSLNRRFRHVDKPTDVLSFPLQELVPGEFAADRDEMDPETGRLPLGDIVISLQRARAQALEYGHSDERETAYLAVHSVLHLLGYDHMDESFEKRRMREREKEIMGKLGLKR